MQNKIIFLGDSLTEWGPWDKLFPENHILNYGIHANKTDDVLARLDAVCQQQANKVFLMIGINDLGEGRTVPEVLRNYQQIVRRVLHSDPLLELFCLSVLPVDTRRFRNPRLRPEQIPLLNQAIAQVAQRYGCGYLSLYELFVCDDLYLDPIFSYDGLHLNAAGYERWRQAIGSCIDTNRWTSILQL